MLLKPGDKIGPYTLVRPLGKGGQGVVWLVEKQNSRTGRKLALKIPFDPFDASDGALPRDVEQEIKNWVRLSGAPHSNIQPLIEAEEHDGLVVLISEYAPSGTLRDWLIAHNGKAPDWATAIQILDGILAGLEHAHSLGVIHRDIKPENVAMFDGVPRLLDFGLSRPQGDTTKTTRAAGTLEYMPPEAFQGKRSKVSDIWAVGVLFQELLTGSRPFDRAEDDDDGMSVMHAICDSKPKALPPAVPAPLRAFVARSLAKRPEARFGSIAEQREFLQTKSAVPEPKARKERRFPRYAPLAAIGVSVVTVVAIAGHNLLPKSTQPSPSPTPISTQSPEPRPTSPTRKTEVKPASTASPAALQGNSLSLSDAIKDTEEKIDVISRKVIQTGLAWSHLPDRTRKSATGISQRKNLDGYAATLHSLKVQWGNYAKGAQLPKGNSSPVSINALVKIQTNLSRLDDGLDALKREIELKPSPSPRVQAGILPVRSDSHPFGSAANGSIFVSTHGATHPPVQIGTSSANNSTLGNVTFPLDRHVGIGLDVDTHIQTRAVPDLKQGPPNSGDVPGRYIGETRSASFTNPSIPPIPESLKSTVLNATTTLRVVFGANGQLRVSVQKSSGYPALDDAAQAAASRIKFKPAMEDGSATDETKIIKMHFGSPIGTTRSASFTNPSIPPIPDSLKSTYLYTTTTLRVVFQANGQLRVSVQKSSGYKALDEAARVAASRIKFKPAMEDGSPTDETKIINMHFTNSD